MSELNKEVVDLVWGRPSSGGVSASIFRRWTQGFVFSENEQTALEQFEGGPCAVIAPVQAFLLKNILFSRESSNWRQMTEEEQKTALCSTLSEILESACSSPSTGFCLVTWAKGQSPHTSTHTNTQTQTQTQSQSQTQDMPEPESSQPPQEQQPKLHGIHKQASVGFLTLMESLRYCKVGAFLKSPKFPIWILGSETHLSVFFTKEMSLVGPESPSEQARRVFQSFDPEESARLPVLWKKGARRIRACNDSPDIHTAAHALIVFFNILGMSGKSVSLVKSKLDPESLGIILLGPFLLEFFPDQDSGIPDSFPIYHYNGLKQSNHNERSILQVYRGPDGSYFGYSVDFYQATSDSNTISVLVGAPKANTSQPGVVEAGAVYYCPWPGSTDSCRQIPFDNSNNRMIKVNGTREPLEFKSHQWFGASVRTHKGKVVACAPLYHWRTVKLSGEKDPVGTCYVAVQNFSAYAEYSPCRTNDPDPEGQGFCQAGFSVDFTKVTLWQWESLQETLNKVRKPTIHYN
ncbi:Integrin alpha-8 [Larimichthys crocea]|uniref:Uncharacterized protein n=1 Tax=Larimichthys crocea TaxID=215358 RepID=A0ACD3QU83_LARCR|nr:Integrin alpha-8 [Larimichthys crocea]